MNRLIISGILGVGLLCLSGGAATAAPKLRIAVDQPGDFALIGSTLGHDCNKRTPLPVVGEIGNCGRETSTVTDSAPDVLWRADSPEAGDAVANAEITAAEARTAAMLEMPAGAKVTHAFLYWGARNASDGGADMNVTLDREGGFREELEAIDGWEVTVNKGKPDEAHVYQAVADVTTIVQAHGPGAYRVGGVDMAPVLDVSDTRNFGGWWMVVLYEAPGMPPRNLAIFDGLDRVSKGYPQAFALEGIRAPEDGLEAKLGVVGYEGDHNIGGDRLFINPSSSSPDPSEALGDAVNPPDNFFNGSRGWLGEAVSVDGDLPQLTGEPQSMPGVDLDVVDVSSKISAGATSIQVLASAAQTDGGAELYFMGGWVTSIASGPGAYLTGSGMFGVCSASAGIGGARGACDGLAPWLFAAALTGLGGLRRARRRP